MPHLRHVVRGLIRTPLFTLTAMLSLALGIGANTAMFSIIDRVLFRTLPVKDPQALAFLYHPGPTQGSTSTDEQGGPSFSYPMFREMQAQQAAFAGLAGARGSGGSISFRNTPAPGSIHMVSGNYFSVLGVGAAIGRLLTDDDDRVPGGHPLVVLSHRYWQSRFGGEGAVLNQTLVVNGQPMTIIGVAEKGFLGEMPGAPRDIFVPISMKKELTPDWDGLNDRQNYWVTMFGRLKPVSSFTEAETAINATYRGQLEQDIALLRDANADYIKRFSAKKIVLRPGDYGRGRLRDQFRTPLMMLIGMTLLVLLIACANVANLQLARASARTREIAVRLALGSSRGQLVRQLLAESGLVALAGGTLGLIVAHWTLRGILASLPPNQASSGVVTTELDLRLLAFSVALSVVTGLLFGLYPAVHASRADLGVALKDQHGQSTATRFTGIFRRTLVTAQIAISLLLLVSAALFAKTLVNLSRVELGLRSDHLVTFAVNPKINRYSNEQTIQFYLELTERLSALPGVSLVSSARVPAIAGSSSSTSITVEGFTAERDRDRQANINEIAPDYFRTLGIPLVAGREFTPADAQPGSPLTVIINEAFARRFFPGQSPIGRRMSRDSGPRDASPAARFDRTIVGVVKDAKYSDLREPVPPVFYSPYGQVARLDGIYFYVRTATEPESMLTSVRATVAGLDPNLPIVNLRTMEAQIENRRSAERLLSRLTGIFGGLATLLAAIGLYGVLAFNVARRTREIGIRIALGANATHVRGLVLRDVTLMLGLGTVAGLSAAAGVSRFLEGMLFSVQPIDAGVYVAASAVLSAIALAAAYVPARRATTVDPLIALRCE
jgi:predicted permease